MSLLAHVEFAQKDDRALLFIILNRLSYLLDAMTQVVDKEELADRFPMHTISSEKALRIQAVQKGAAELAELIRSNSTAGREQSLAFTHLEIASMFATKSISRET